MHTNDPLAEQTSAPNRVVGGTVIGGAVGVAPAPQGDESALSRIADDIRRNGNAISQIAARLRGGNGVLFGNEPSEVTGKEDIAVRGGHLGEIDYALHEQSLAIAALEYQVQRLTDCMS